MNTTKVKVWHPSKGVQWVESIASAEEHFGNLVAEGHIPEDMFWPSVVRHYQQRLLQTERKIFAEQDVEQSAAYAASWVDRYIEDVWGDAA